MPCPKTGRSKQRPYRFFMKRPYLADLGIALALLAGNLLLLAPHLTTDFTAQVWNNDYIHIGLARMYRQHPWSWNALWYCGFPFSYAYLPLFPLLLAAAPVASLGRAYHLVSGIAYALVPATLYVMCLALFRARLPAALAAIAYSILPSPIYLSSGWANLARGFSAAPWPFVTLIAYAEAPHILAVALLPLAVAAAWHERWVLASVCVAAIFLTNWPGAVGALMALAAVGVAQARNVGYGRAAARVLATAAVGYGLAAFWITADYFHTLVLLARALRYGEHQPAPWTAATWAVLAVVAAMLGAALWRRTPPLTAFLLAWLALSGAPVEAFDLARSQLLVLPWRYAMEFNMALVVAAAALACLGRRWRVAMLVTAVALAGFAARGFLRRSWELHPRGTEVENLLAYQISTWLQRNAAGSRVFTVGELNGALNVWADVPQVVGGTAQGITNPLVVAAHKEVAQGCTQLAARAELAELWLRALDVRYVVVHWPASREYFHWYVNPEKFSGLPVAWSNGAGDTIYRLPSPELHDAVVVDASALSRLPPLRSTDDLEFLRAYAAWTQGERPARLRWLRSDAAEIEAELKPGEALLVKVNYDRGWRAPGARTRPDPIGFLLLELPAGQQRLTLRYGAAWDVWLGRAITLATIVLLLARVRMHIVALVALLPMLVAYAAVASASPRAAIAEQTLARVQPPIILPGGIVDRETITPPPLARNRPVSIYGLNLGGTADRVQVWVEQTPAELLSRSPNHLVVRLPDAAGASAEVTVEVNGCRGNSFLVPLRD